MKSAYELAMERLAKAAPEPALTPAQKEQLAGLNTIYQAKLAERETFLHGLLAKAAFSGDAGEEAQLRQQLARDTQTLREEWDAKKEAVWREAGRQ